MEEPFTMNIRPYLLAGVLLLFGVIWLVSFVVSSLWEVLC